MPAGGIITRPEAAVRPATPADAADMARLGDIAGHGLSRYLWARQAAPGEDPLAVGARRAARDEGAFSWRRAVIAETGGHVAGLLVTYRIADAPAPLADLPPMFHPIQALENRVPGSLYVNMLATYPAFRRRGVATALLAEAARRAATARGLSLIVADDNHDARRLYRGFGFTEIAEEPLVAEGWTTRSRAWVLMAKPR